MYIIEYSSTCLALHAAAYLYEIYVSNLLKLSVNVCTIAMGPMLLVRSAML